MNKKTKLRMLVEGGIMIALAMVLSMIRLYKMPQGGSVTAASMMPIMLFAMRWGVPKGVLVGTLYGILQFIMEPYTISPIQMLLDYPIAFGALGLAGIVRGLLKDNKRRIKWVVSGCALGMLLRTLSHVVSGAIFFKEYAGAMNPWLYSIQYNASYMAVELVITSIIIYVIWQPVEKAAPATDK